MQDLSEYITKIIGLLKYDPNSPMLFTSGLFLFLFAGFMLVYQAMRHRMMTRIIYVTLFSLFFYYKTSGFYFLLLVILSLSDFSIGYLISQSQSALKRKILIILSIGVNVGILCYFKYTNLLLTFFSGITNHDLEFQDIFLPIGVSFFTFQSMSYVIDIYRNKIKPVELWIDYLFYLSFFPQLVAGPIVRARDFIPQIYQRNIIVSRKMFGEGIFLIMSGLFKKAIISDYISLNFVDRIFDNPSLYSGLENLMGVYGYALQIYCDFSGYSDMAIGIALLLGFRFNINFDSPYKSATITEFWRRWHISLSSWLRDYLYISMGGSRKGRIRTYINLMLTMLIGGLWHGAAVRFILWGAFHGIGLAVHKFVMSIFPSFRSVGGEMVRWRRIIGILITFNFVCFSWIFFRADDMDTAKTLLTRIFTEFHPEIAWEFLVGYKYVIILMGVGYLLHFAPKSLENRTGEWVAGLPIVVQALAITILIWCVFQIKSSEIQPFIYFQF